LLCVRYRYDVIRGVRLKTVELVVEKNRVVQCSFFRMVTWCR
jgi:hypothetical protein